VGQADMTNSWYKAVEQSARCKDAKTGNPVSAPQDAMLKKD